MHTGVALRQRAWRGGGMQKYRLISRQGEGTFSEVFKAQSVKTGRYTAIKCMKNKFDSIEQVRASVLTLRIVVLRPGPGWRATNPLLNRSPERAGLRVPRACAMFGAPNR